MKERRGGESFEAYLYRTWQASKKLREDLEEYLRTSTINMTDGKGQDRIDLLSQALRIESEAKAEYDAW